MMIVILSTVYKTFIKTILYIFKQIFKGANLTNLIGDMKINRYRLLSFVFQMTLVLGFLGSKSFAQDEGLTVYEFSIHEDINANAWRNTQQAYLKASLEHADVILIKMNTFGGLVN